jgi:prevent-host-death family protein
MIRSDLEVHDENPSMDAAFMAGMKPSRRGNSKLEAPKAEAIVSITTLSSREFNRAIGRAKKAAERGPVVITDRGEPAYVLLSFDEFRRLRGDKITLLAALEKLPDIDFDFEPPRLSGPTIQPADFD